LSNVKGRPHLHIAGEADLWKELKQSKLYMAIMKKAMGWLRIPNIKSLLYQESPAEYADRILRVAKQY